MFRANGHFFWIPVIGQLIGGVLGALIYIFTIEMHHPAEDRTPLVHIDDAEDSKL